MNPNLILLAIAVAVIAFGINRSSRRLLTFVYSAAAIAIGIAATFVLTKIFPAVDSVVSIGAIASLFAGCIASLVHSRKDPGKVQEKPAPHVASEDR